MENKIRPSGYDFIKLVFALAVAVFLYAAFRPPAQPKPAVETTLPAYPPANFEWEYDPARRELLNPQGVQLYRLAEDGVTWSPIIPASLSLQLPGEYRLVQNSRRAWQILDAVGVIVSSWDTENFRWVMGIIPTATLPRPTSTLQATVTPTLTLVPTATPSPPTLTPTATQTATQSCNTAAQTHLTAGQPARVLINLKLHATPEMDDNVIGGNPAGVVVDALRGPVCVPNPTGGAYWWWEIRNAEGITGWAVEATLNGSVYFLEPFGE